MSQFTRNKSRRYRQVLASVVGLLTALGQATAQSVDNRAAATSVAEPASLDEVIVTARRVEERLQDVPISITVFNQEQLSEHNVSSAADLAAYTPSLSANSNFGNENTSFVIRGFVQDNGTAPTVGVYFADVVAPRGPSNGVPAGDGAGPGYLFDLENVQILKGPQGTLFGRNTTGGAVLLIPQKPTANFGGYAELSAGNYGMERLQAALNAPLNDNLRFRLAVDRQSRDGYLNNDSGVGPGKFDGINYTAVRASLVWDVLPQLENYTILTYSKSDTDGSTQKVIACDPNAPLFGMLCGPQAAREQARGAGFYTVQSDVNGPHSLLEQWQLINTSTWHESDTLTLKNIASYGQLLDNLRTGLFGTDWSFAGKDLTLTTVQPPPGLETAHEYTLTEEFQVQGSALDSRLTYQGGAYLELSRPINEAGSQSPGLISCTDSLTLQCTDTIGQAFTQGAGGFPVHIGAVNYTVGQTSYRDVGLYSQATYQLTKHLDVTGGIRYTWDHQENTSLRQSYTFPVNPPFTAPPQVMCTDSSQVAAGCVEHLDADSRAPTWLIDLDYKPTDDVLLYGSYKRGYRAGGVFPNAPTTYRVFEPEKVDTYETGLKTSFHFPVPGTFDVAAFYNDFTNQQLQVGFNGVPGSGQSSTTGILNAGKSKIYGAEVEASIRPFSGFTFDAAYTYLRAYIVSIAPLISTDPNYSLGSQILPGDNLFLSPRNKYTLTGEYALPISERIGHVTVGATFTHTDSQITTYADSPPAIEAGFGVSGDLGKLAPLNLLDLNASWKDIAGTPLDLSFFATNVTKRKYYVFVAGIGSTGFESAAVGPPCMYGVRIRYKFGR
jgi:iron complex outermembrane recepter protein